MGWIPWDIAAGDEWQQRFGKWGGGRQGKVVISSPKPGLRSRVQSEFSGVGGGVGRGAGEDECSCFEMLAAGVVGGGLRGRHAGPVFDHWEIVWKVWQSGRPVGDESGGGRSRMGGDRGVDGWSVSGGC